MAASNRRTAASDLRQTARDLADRLAGSVRDVMVRAAGAAGYYPAVESFIQDDQLVIRADLPGLDPGHVETSVRGNRLTIKAERRRNRDEKGRRARHLHREISYGTFRRELELPEGVKREDITATYANGVLEVTLPVSAELRQRVPVASEGEGRKQPVKVRRAQKARERAA